jgi:hypothetical protein
MQRTFGAKLALWGAAGASFCGLAPSASAIVYDRNAAVAYANQYWNKVVSDGYFWINGSTANYYGAGAPVPVNAPNEAGGIGDDCAHFVSSVIGTPAGGLTIPSRAGTYGEPGAARLDELLVGNSLGGYGTTYKYGQLVTSVSQLTPGDVIGYDWTGSGGGSMSGIDHTVFYLGNNQIAAHATSHDGVAWNWANSSSTITFLIHITVPNSIVPTAPSNVSPAMNTSVSNLTPRLTANAFIDGAIGSTQVAAQWEIFNGSTLVYEDNFGGWSSYSAATSLSITLAGVAGDYTNNGIVDTADYLLWRKNQGTSNVLPNDAIGGKIGAAQYDQWRAHLGQIGGISSGAVASAAVPEPRTLSLLFLAAAGVWTRYRRKTSPTPDVVNPRKPAILKSELCRISRPTAPTGASCRKFHCGLDSTRPLS